MSFFFQELVNGITTGALYSLIALGFSMVYGVLKLLNFAHGDLYMVGAYIGFFVIQFFGGAAKVSIPVPLLLVIMFVLAGGVFAFGAVVKNFPDSSLWQLLGYEFEHVPWTGCAFWDLIQPSFMFMVRVAIPYSHASRIAKGQSSIRIAAHVTYRSVVLILLGVFLASTGSRLTRTHFIFTNVLAQIGLGYAFVYLLVRRSFAF